MKTKKWAKLTAVTLAAATCISTNAFAGELTFPLEEPVTIKVTAVKRPLHTSDFKDMPFNQEWSDAVGVNIEWNEVSDTSFMEKMNLDFASGDMADVYIGPYCVDDNTVLRYAQTGQIIPLNSYIDEYCDNIKAAFEKYPEYKSITTGPDGNIYSLLKVVEEGQMIPASLFINKVWLENLGLEVPGTMEEFYNVLKAFKTQDPNGNGREDEIPFSAIANFDKIDYSLFSIFGAFGVATDMNGFIIEGGQVKFAPMQDGWKEACKYFNRLYTEGLLDNECFTQDESLYTAKGQQEDETYGALIGYNAMNYVGQDCKEDYVAIPIPAGPEGKQSIYKNSYNGVTKNSVILTSNNKYPEITMKWIDYVYSPEKSVEASYGPIGYNVQYNDDGVLELITTSPEGMTFGEWRNKWSLATTCPTICVQADLQEAGIFAGNPNGFSKLEECDMYDAYAVEEVMPPVYLEMEDASEVSMIKSDIMGQALQMTARWISGESDVDADWDSYVETLNRIGVETYVSIYQKAYDQYLANK